MANKRRDTYPVMVWLSGDGDAFIDQEEVNWADERLTDRDVAYVRADTVLTKYDIHNQD